MNRLFVRFFLVYLWCFLAICGGQVCVDGFFIRTKRRPKIEECLRERTHAFARDFDTAILPVAKTLFFRDILVSDIDSACEADFAVNHQNFAVVAVVHSQSEKRNDGVEADAFDVFVQAF